MFFYISKLLAFALAPLNWIIVFVVVAVFTKKANRKKMMLLSAFVFLVFFSNTFILKKVYHNWEVPPVADIQLAKKYDYGIYLSNPVKYAPGKGILNFSAAPSRLFKTIELYEQNKIRKIIISGGSSSLSSDSISEAELIKQYLLSIDIPKRHIIIEGESRNTHENAVYTKALIDSIDEGATCLLITSASHMKRANACFYQERLEVDQYPVGHFALEGETKFYDLFVPDHRNFIIWDYIIHEIAGFYIYSIMGWV